MSTSSRIKCISITVVGDDYPIEEIKVSREIMEELSNYTDYPDVKRHGAFRRSATDDLPKFSETDSVCSAGIADSLEHLPECSIPDESVKKLRKVNISSISSISERDQSSNGCTMLDHHPEFSMPGEPVKKVRKVGSRRSSKSSVSEGDKSSDDCKTLDPISEFSIPDGPVKELRKVSSRRSSVSSVSIKDKSTDDCTALEHISEFSISKEPMKWLRKVNARRSSISSVSERDKSSDDCTTLDHTASTDKTIVLLSNNASFSDRPRRSSFNKIDQKFSELQKKSSEKCITMYKIRKLENGDRVEGLLGARLSGKKFNVKMEEVPDSTSIARIVSLFSDDSHLATLPQDKKDSILQVRDLTQNDQQVSNPKTFATRKFETYMAKESISLRKKSESVSIENPKSECALAKKQKTQPASRKKPKIDLKRKSKVFLNGRSNFKNNHTSKESKTGKSQHFMQVTVSAEIHSNPAANHFPELDQCSSSVTSDFSMDSKKVSFSTEFLQMSFSTVSTKKLLLTDSQKETVPTDIQKKSCVTDFQEESVPTDTQKKSYVTDFQEESVPTDTHKKSYLTDSQEESVPTDTHKESCLTDFKKEYCVTNSQKESSVTDSPKKSLSTISQKESISIENDKQLARKRSTAVIMPPPECVRFNQSGQVEFSDFILKSIPKLVNRGSNKIYILLNNIISPSSGKMEKLMFRVDLSTIPFQFTPVVRPKDAKNRSQLKELGEESSILHRLSQQKVAGEKFSVNSPSVGSDSCVTFMVDNNPVIETEELTTLDDGKLVSCSEKVNPGSFKVNQGGKKVTPGDKKVALSNSFNHWTCQDVQNWLRSHGLGRFINDFLDLDGKSLVELVLFFKEDLEIVHKYLRDMGFDISEKLTFTAMLRNMSKQIRLPSLCTDGNEANLCVSINHWTCLHVSRWLSYLGLARFKEKFAEVDGPRLEELFRCFHQNSRVVHSILYDMGLKLPENLKLCVSLRANIRVCPQVNVL